MKISWPVVLANTCVKCNRCRNLKQCQLLRASCRIGMKEKHPLTVFLALLCVQFSPPDCWSPSVSLAFGINHCWQWRKIFFLFSSVFVSVLAGAHIYMRHYVEHELFLNQEFTEFTARTCASGPLMLHDRRASQIILCNLCPVVLNFLLLMSRTSRYKKHECECQHRVEFARPSAAATSDPTPGRPAVVFAAIVSEEHARE